MAFEKEKDALDGVFNGLDKACRTGAFGLQEAANLMLNVNTIGTLLHGGVSAVLSQIVQPPAEEQPAGEGPESEQLAEVVPGTNDRVAQPK
ncbi:hypothetical protein [Dyadobacter fermentans]|uniref:hypothetical protein n=1 Tax=Dyadobacter fermentans TaxID=94254 RepID=UPI001CBCE992|nr:hypothetical protein [Dyadobacter fermentans]MBZ1362132.1 hypothetical protein [Dyadobacter fermentans]